MTHLFRPADPTPDAHSPSWKMWRGLLYVVGGQLLARAGRLFRSPHSQRLLAYLLLAVGLVGQTVLLFLAAYLVDLSVSLMELWADLARKHLELTV
jgi:hypothetical protein